MRTIATLLAAALGACLTHEPGPPPDAGQEDPPPLWRLPVGASGCDRESAFCSGAQGLCVEGTCRLQCSPVDYPRCPDGFEELHRALDGGDSCTCVPTGGAP